MSRTKATNIAEVITENYIMSKNHSPIDCPCGGTRYVYGGSMDGHNIYKTYKCPDCGSMETVTEDLK